jgi:hypothetical protein
MKNILKGIFFKLSYNLTLRKIANKIFVYFPTMKSKLVALRDSSYSPKEMVKPVYESDFLDTIKQEIEEQREKGELI